VWKLNAPGDQELAEENLNLQIRLSVGEAPAAGKLGDGVTLNPEPWTLNPKL